MLQNQKAKQVDTTDAFRLTPETIYILETYQASEDRVSKKTKTLPAMMAGKNRNELEQLIQDYVTNYKSGIMLRMRSNCMEYLNAILVNLLLILEV